MVYTENVGFEWDFVKTVANVLKHGITFEEATLAFYDPKARFENDIVHSAVDELRIRWIGFASKIF